MERSRRNSSRRKFTGNPSSASPRSPPESPFPRGHSASISPVMSLEPTSPQTTALQGRRASKPLQHAFSFSTPGSGRNLNLRKRSKTSDNYGSPDDPDDPDGSKKGGHSLRKKARVNYKFEQIDDEVVVPNSSSVPKGSRKRTSDGTESSELLQSSGSGSASRRSRDFYGAETPSSRRRNGARNFAEITSYPYDLDEDDKEPRDTIEVGLSYSDMDDSDTPQSTHSNGPQPAQVLGGSQGMVADMGQYSDYVEPKMEMDVEESDQIMIDPELSFQPEPGEFVDGSADQLQFESSQNFPTEDFEHQSMPQSFKRETEDISAVMDPALEASMREPSVQEEPNTSQSATVGEQATTTFTLPDPPAALTQVSQSSPQLAEAHESSGTSVEVRSTSQPPEPTTPGHRVRNFADPEPVEAVDSKAASPGPSIVVKEVESRSEPVSNARHEMAPVVNDNQAQPPPAGSRELTPSTDSPAKPVTQRPAPSKPVKYFKPQPAPEGRWSNLTPYLEGEFQAYPEKSAQVDDSSTGDDQPTEDTSGEKESNDIEPMVEDNDDAVDLALGEVATPAINTPSRGSPVPGSIDPIIVNSPGPAAEDADEADMSDSPELAESKRFYRYRKLRDADEYVNAVESFEDMTTEQLYDILEACNVSLRQWQSEYAELGKTVDDYENAQRRRAADSKYESRTRNLNQYGVNFDEPEFVFKGYKAKEKEPYTDTRYLQTQDRLMASAYGFEYDPHPSKIGKQNPETQQSGIMTRGRSLRNQPRQTAKATEGDEVTGKRLRKPVQLFEPGTAQQDSSRATTPVPTRGRRRRAKDAEDATSQVNVTSSFNEDVESDTEGATVKPRRKRGPRAKAAVPEIVENIASDETRSPAAQGEVSRSGRRGRKPRVTYDEVFPGPQGDQEEAPRSEPRQPKRMLTLKLPKSQLMSGPSSVITDNGDSRPSTASSESSTHTVESSYSFRPKRQKRFRDEVEEAETPATEPAKKKGKRNSGTELVTEDQVVPSSEIMTPEPAVQNDRKIQKIKLVRAAPPSTAEPESRNGTPSSVPSAGNGEDRKDYKTMTKSEKMSASMKSRWANGNMAGAVEKRKATLAAKKAALAAAEARQGAIAPRPNIPQPGQQHTPTPEMQAPYMHMPLGIPGMGFPFPPGLHEQQRH